MFIGDTEATFDATSRRGGDMVRWMHNEERELLNEILEELDGDDVFLDVGANVGYHSTFAANKLSGGHVMAVEPYPPNVDQLRRNVSYNCALEKVSVFDIALSDSAGTLDLTVQQNDVGNQTPDPEGNGTPVSVEMMRGDTLVKTSTIGTPAVVKVDVEGAEESVLRGLSDVLKNDSCRALFVEIHRNTVERPLAEDESSEDDLLNLISEFGFSIEHKRPRASEVHVKATK